MTQLLDWHYADDPSELVRHAVEALARGEIVAFPTETVYTLAVCAAQSDAVERLHHITRGGPELPLSVAVQDETDALEWVPEMSAMGRRLARRCWPGPVTLVFDRDEQGLVGQLPEAVRSRVCPNATLALLSPAHEAIQHALHLLGDPLLLSEAHREGEPPAVAAAQVVENLADAIDVVLDDGPTRYGQSGTVVRVSGESWRVLRPGLVTEAMLRRQAAFWILFLCTGNTCRSPLAEALCKKLLADKLGCTPAELPERGFLVLSAGLAAMMGGAAATEAVEIARELGADLSNHRSRPLSAELAEQADCIVAMTDAHRLTLTSYFPHLLERSRLLDPAGDDIPDPIGCEQEVYRECAVTIARHLEAHLPRWLAGR